MECRKSFLRSLVCLAALLATLAVAPAQSWQVTPLGEFEYTVYGPAASPRYAVRNRGGETLLDQPLDTKIRLRDGAFDPLHDEIPAPAPLLRAREGNRLFLLQFVIPGVPSFRTALAAEGVEVLQFLPSATHLVRTDAARVEALLALPFVRAMVPFHPGWRLDAQTRSALLGGVLPTARYNVLVTRSGLAEKQSLAEAIEAMGGSFEPLVPQGRLMTVTLSASALTQVLNRNEVHFLDPWGALENDLDNARILGGADFVQATAGYDGTGVNAEVMDSGLRTTHQNINPPTIHASNGSSLSHGTAVYGIVFGTGNHDPTATGIMPAGTGIFASYSGILGNPAVRYPHTQELQTPQYEAVFQTNSAGSPRTFFYTTISASMDEMLFDLDFVVLQSQSNAGNQDSRPQAWAKNIVSCGGIRHYNTLTEADDAWSGGASIGPAQDGRIKPDLSFFYDNIRTTSSGSDTSYTNTFGGTSGATPLTAGHMGLMHQMWADGIFGNTVNPGAGVFANRPHMTTAKAMLINTARQYAFSGTGVDLTRVHQGWGRPDLERAWTVRNRMLIVDESDLITPFQTNTYQINVLPTDPELRVTMIFADPEGDPAAAEARVNDLTLRVVSPSGLVYFGNNGLLAGNFSTPGGSANTVDNVENVYVNGPEVGAWMVEVIATEINEDGHVETPALDADYALVISGADGNVVPPQPPTGQPNSADASLTLPGAVNSLGQPATTLGIQGPFITSATAGSTLTLTVEGQPNQPFLLAIGPVNANNLVIPTIGSLDIGTDPSLSDLSIVLNGLAPVTFLDALAVTDGTGQLQLNFAAPPSLTGSSMGAFQAAVLQQFGITLSGAVELLVF